MKHAIGILIEIALNLLIAVGSMDIFNAVNFLYPWTWYVLPLICIFFNCSLQCFIIFQLNLFYIFGWIYSKLCHYAILNGIAFLVSFSGSSLLVYKNATDFWIFSLYPVTLLNWFINSSIFFWWNQGSLYTVSCDL